MTGLVITIQTPIDSSLLAIVFADSGKMPFANILVTKIVIFGFKIGSVGLPLFTMVAV